MAIATSVPPLPFVSQEFHGAPIVAFYAAYAGDPGEGETAIRSLRVVDEPAVDLSDRMPFVALHDIVNGLFPSGNRDSWHSLYATEATDDLIDLGVAHASRRPGPEASIEICHLGGAVSGVAPDATARAHPDAEFLAAVSATWRDPAEEEVHLGWAEAASADLRESDATLEAFYPGFPGFFAGEERARMVYGENLGRLADLKAEYDSEHLLNSNLNVEPPRSRDSQLIAGAWSHFARRCGQFG